MILFHSDFCNHCKMLLEHIKRYDKEKTIKLVSIDDLRIKNMNIGNKIHSVPAFMILPSKELLFGKAVFDYLLLPGRGILCSTQSTRIDRTNSENTGGDSGGVNGDNIPLANINAIEGEPMAFTLNSSSFSDNFSIIEDESKELNDKNYKWDFITNDSNISDGIPNNSKDETSMKRDKNTQSIEELQKIRDAQKF
jgi:Thioredoxin